VLGEFARWHQQEWRRRAHERWSTRNFRAQWRAFAEEEQMGGASESDRGRRRWT
jgi:hypothetical protein